MKLLIDMNLSPKWVSVLENAGWEAVHWSIIGRPDASDHEILRYAKFNGYVIFMHDLDIGNILAVTKADCPSVIQVRVQDVIPQHLRSLVISALRQFERYLEEGALVTINEKKSRAHILRSYSSYNALIYTNNLQNLETLIDYVNSNSCANNLLVSGVAH